MKKKLGIAFCGLLLAAPMLALAQQAAAPEAGAAASLVEAKAAEKAMQSSQLDSALFYQLLVAELTLQEEEPAAGFAIMLDAARKTGDAQLYQRATEIALQSRSGDGALQAARAWAQNQPTSRDANRYVLQILIALNRIAETAEPIKTELRLAPDAERPQVMAALPRAYARVKDTQLASAVVEAALSDYLHGAATSSAAWAAVSRMRLMAEDQAGALEAAKKGQAADANATGPILVALELISPKTPEAEAMVRTYLASNPKAQPEVRLAFTQALLNAQRYGDASAQLQIMVRDQPDFSESWLILGSLQLQDNQLAASQASLERYVTLAEKEPVQADRKRRLSQAYLSLSQLAEKKKDYAAAEAWLKKIEDPADLARVQTRRASILASQGKIDQARQLIQQLPERNEEDARLKVSAEVNLLRDAKKYQLASELLADSLVKAPQDTDLLYEQAMMVEKLGKHEEMERLLRQVIKLKPDSHNAYNALGYSLADRNIRLTEARQLIQNALEYTPADPFIQDSLGWVEFRLGNKAQALKIFEIAYKAKPDAEIAAHFGEVLLSMGERERALAIWREGQRLNAENETLVETLKRLRIKL